MNGWFAVLVVLGCTVTAPILGWLIVRMILPKSPDQRKAKRDTEDPT